MDWRRRNFIKAALGGLAGLSAADVFRARATAAEQGKSVGRKSVILLWMAGGPSQIDTWDPKPDRPLENRGPFAPIATAVPGVFVCEHLPRQAAMLDKFTIIRSVDCAGSDHSPSAVLQTGNRQARPATNPRGSLYPAIGSFVAKFKGPNQPGMPPYVAFNRDPDHVPGGGYLGMQYDPLNGHRAAGLPDYSGFGRLIGYRAQVDEAMHFQLPEGVGKRRMLERRNLSGSLDRVRADLDLTGTMDAMDHFQQQAVEMILGGRAQAGFDISREPQAVRDRYGKHLWCQQALLARRLVEAGVSFVTIDLSLGVNAGDWDSHGREHAFGGIVTSPDERWGTKGLQPLLPVFDHLITTLVADLEERSMLDDVLILALGDFGRDPVIGTQGGFTGGRNHWPRVMSMCLAGGGLNHGQVIGSSDAPGGEIKDRPVTPADLAATIYRHMGVPLDATYLDNSGRPNFIVDENGQPISELF
ncbi:DUF1501 domain-containing protein [Lignipirellula cremea]|uniref:DUF1501 domain-containing protein n=1 Tax=Lignipirellula cremea TaxID=2528010 RepID=A0A518DZ43_9BACT|nr:DUF1501 domain-containing protein [Lignipirellula cremea]QDU97117.1 hypothetical protein Pla8534_49620 [Lignipirellula cremea]